MLAASNQPLIAVMLDPSEWINDSKRRWVFVTMLCCSRGIHRFETIVLRCGGVAKTAIGKRQRRRGDCNSRSKATNGRGIPIEWRRFHTPDTRSKLNDRCPLHVSPTSVMTSCDLSM